jgi:hypothetical protein
VSAPQAGTPARAQSLFSRPSRRVVAAIVACWVVAALPGLAVLVRDDFRWGAFGEALSYLALALAVASIAPLRATFAQLSRPLGALLVVVAIAAVFGQLAGGTPKAFPGVRFNVFTDEAGDQIAVTKLEGVTAAGPKVIVSGDEVFRSLDKGRFATFHGRLLRASGLASGTPNDGGLDAYRRFVAAVLRQYNDEHPDAPLAAIRVVTYEAPAVAALGSDRGLRRVPLITVRPDGTFVVAKPTAREARA